MRRFPGPTEEQLLEELLGSAGRSSEAAARRRPSLVSLAAACPSLALHNLDAFTLHGRAWPTPLPPAVARTAQGMRWPNTVAMLSFATAMILQLASGWEGMCIFDDGVPDACGRLRAWMRTYCVLIPMFMITCLPMHFAFVFLWSIVGLCVRHYLRAPGACEAQAPRAYAFVGDVAKTVTLSISLCVLSVIILWCVHHRMGRLHHMWGTSGPLAGEVVQRILEEAALPDPAATAVECSICLESADEAHAEEGEAQRWRQLRCGHVFHERCLLEWLGRSRQCPLCRLNLQTAYMQSGMAGWRTMEVPAAPARPADGAPVERDSRGRW